MPPPKDLINISGISKDALRKELLEALKSSIIKEDTREFLKDHRKLSWLIDEGLRYAVKVYVKPKDFVGASGLGERCDADTVLNIAGIPKKELLLELLKNAEVASFFCTREPPSLDIDEIWKEYEELTRYISLVDYLRGRCLKVDISGNTMNPSTFDSEYGEGKFAEIVDKLRGRYPLPRDRKEGNNSVEDHKTN
ncbi:hypothetical protein G4B84_002995 [Aspergillus flavus NRRL3357]|nr:uncharacterized protein G4B84_002995 [Aspergillus flavus NRRL3357]QMW27706.1 hypothetical protein G4B84_002995 [Aspergillus flavus NRRL3357]QMW39777.1 hypothetical protein G4B11_003057 [Aspergillus flavus]